MATNGNSICGVSDAPSPGYLEKLSFRSSEENSISICNSKVFEQINRLLQGSEGFERYFGINRFLFVNSRSLKEPLS